MRFEEAARVYTGPYEDGLVGYTWLLFFQEREESARARVYVAGYISRRLFTRGGSSTK